MKNFKDRLFVGNIIQRTFVDINNDESSNNFTNPWFFIYKENAVLFKTKNGAYIDIDGLNLPFILALVKINSLDKIKPHENASYELNNITIMPSFPSINKDFIYGRFVDESSLILYNDFIKEQSKQKSKKHI